MNTARVSLAAIVLSAAVTLPAAAKPPLDTHRLGQRLVAKLAGRSHTPSPQTHSTDFAGQTLGCITLKRFEMQDLGYPGHAFLCEDDASGETLGAVLSRTGRVVCHISGNYAGNDCYALTICDAPDTLCVR